MKTVLILGASRYYLRSIEAARAAGYRVIAVDRNPDSPGFSGADDFAVCDIVDKQGVLALAKQFNANGIVPVNDYGVPTAAYVASQLGLPGISERTAFLSSDKAAMREKWLADGVPCPVVREGQSESELRLAIEEVGFPCILKPAHGIGGASRGVIVVKNQEEVTEAIRFSQSFYADKSTLVESFIEAEVEHSAEVLVYNGIVHVIAISDKVKTPLPFRVDKNVLYPTSISGDKLHRLKETIQKAVLSLGITQGAAHVELATAANGFVLFELGARCGGGGTPEPIVPYVSGVSEFTDLVRICCGDRPLIEMNSTLRGCNYHFIVLKPGVVAHVAGWDAITSDPDVLDAELFVKPGSVIEEVKTGLQRSGFIIVGGSDRDAAYRKGLELESRLQITYAS
jgi:biotin carboxylase